MPPCKTTLEQVPTFQNNCESMPRAKVLKLLDCNWIPHAVTICSTAFRGVTQCSPMEVRKPFWNVVSQRRMASFGMLRRVALDYMQQRLPRCDAVQSDGSSQAFLKCSATKKNGVFWDVTPCGSCKNRRHRYTYRLHHQSDKDWRARSNVSSHWQPKHVVVFDSLYLLLYL
jgi:hypothetical protein